MSSEYHPKKSDLTIFEKRPELRRAAEYVAAKIHDGWAVERMAHGWTFGMERNDKDKKHPSLIPYADLSESEKELDRVAARETIAALLDLGYEITPPK